MNQNDQHSTKANCNYHISCDTLLYGHFLKILIGGDVKQLVISGEPSETELRQAWAAILSEYSEAIHTEKTQSIFALWRKINYTSWMMAFIESALTYLKQKYDHEVALKVMELGYEFIEDNSDRDTYLKQIYRVQKDAKVLTVLLNQYTNEYKSLVPESDELVTRTMADYDKELALLGKFVGHRINKYEYTVSEVIAIINLYLEENQKK